MLTNNKNFVRSIAMLLAMLMVMALCLTGCGNKAADEALAKAEEAKTVADEVKAALAGYLTTADAEAKVAALVDAALADGVATKAEIAELSAKLADYVTLAQVEALITEKVAASAIAGAMTKAEIEEILANYYTKEEIDAKFENYFGEFTAEEVLTILKDAMSLKEWDKTSDVVLETIEDLQVLLEALETETYTQANMAKVNECLAPFNIVVFAKNAGATRLSLQNIDEIAKALEYTILRQATLEDMAELKAAVDAAVAVPTFQKSFAALKADLYGLGDLYTVGAYDGTNGAWNPDKYLTNGNYYHEAPIAKNAAQQVQIVTLVDKAGFHAFNQAHDALLAEYYADATYATGADGWIENLAAYNVYKETTNTYGTVTTDLKILLTTADTIPSNYEKLGTTVITDDAYLNKVYMGELKENEVLVSPLYVVDTTALNYGDVTTDYKNTNTFANVIDDFDMTQTGKGTWMSAYTLVYAQLDYVQILADYANNIFEGGVTTDADNTFAPHPALTGSFLKDVIYDNTATMFTTKYADVTDAAFLTALTAAMCEPITGDKNTVTGEYKYEYYLLDDVDPIVKNFKMANGQAYDANLGGFDRWELYEAMMDKSFDLLWNKYKAQANEWANIILKDYISVVYEAKANTVGNVDGAAAIAVKYTDTTKLAADMSVLGTGLTAGETTTAAELTAGFLSVFLTGKDTANNDFANSKIYTALELTDKWENSNLLAFYLHNGKAMVSTTKADGSETAPSYGKVYANPLAAIAKDAENIRQRLTGSATYTELQIARADMATYKATGVSVREAFYDLLKEEIDNLDEIYGRFLFEDYKKLTYNEMAVKAGKIVTFYNKGVANAAQAAAVERYLTGVANEATVAYETGINVVYNTANPKKITSATFKANDLEGTLTNGFLVTNVSKVTCDLWATSSPSGTELVADAAMAKVDAFAAEATATIENMLVKANFLNYLYEARGNLAAANITYTNYIMEKDPTAWDIKSTLINENGLADDQITVVEFFHNRNDYKLADYKTAYVENVLTLVADKENLHVLLLGDKTIDEIVELADQAAEAAEVFKTELKKVLSSDDAKASKWVVGKYSPYTANADYYYIGTYAVALDKILNTMPGRVTTYKTDAGNVNLY